jgi:hypothetical protein
MTAPAPSMHPGCGHAAPPGGSWAYLCDACRCAATCSGDFMNLGLPFNVRCTDKKGHTDRHEATVYGGAVTWG